MTREYIQSESEQVGSDQYRGEPGWLDSRGGMVRHDLEQGSDSGLPRGREQLKRSDTSTQVALTGGLRRAVALKPASHSLTSRCLGLTGLRS